MIAMDKVHSIRQLFYEQGKSVSAIAAETGHDRKTISKYLDMTDFNTPEPKKEDPENMCPKLDAYKPLIDQWLLDDRKAPRKQRHTAKRVFKRLQTETEDWSYVKKKYKLNMPFLVLSYPAKASALLSNAA